MGKICVKEGCRPLANNSAIVAYARQQINCRSGFSPAPDHSILVCEGYVTTGKSIDEFLQWLAERAYQSGQAAKIYGQGEELAKMDAKRSHKQKTRQREKGVY